MNDATAIRLPDSVASFCVTESEAHRAIDAIIADARSGLIAVDTETAPGAVWSERLVALRRELADARGKYRAAARLRTQVARLRAEVKRLSVAIAYCKTAGLDPHRARIRLLQLYSGGRRVAVVDLDRAGRAVLQRLNDLRVVVYNAAFDLAFLEAEDVSPLKTLCAMQAVRLTLGSTRTLREAAREYLDVDLGKELQTSDWNAPHLSKEQINYAAQDAVVTWRLARRVLPALDKQASAYDIQMQAVPAAMRMQQRGFKLDVAAHALLIDNLESERIEAEQAYIRACQAHGLVGIGGRIPDTPERKRALLKAILTSDELGSWRKTEKSGVLSTKRSDLRRAAHYPPIVELVRISTIDKLLSSFGVGFAELVNPVTGRIHASYHVAATTSGRASCSAPNLQQIPRDHRFRNLFVPDPGNILVVADYSSMELRAAAYISSDAAMTRAFEEDLDLHRITAAYMSGKSLEEVTSEERRAAKAVNFGAIYGIGAEALVQSAWDSSGILLDPTEAKLWLAAFAASYPTFARWRREHYERCEAEHRIVIGKDAARGIGRIFLKSHLRGDESFYTRSCNLPVQGACADASMLALAYVDDRLFEADIDGGLVAWLHDEFVLEVRADQARQAAEILKQAMIDAFVETFPGAPLNGLVKPGIGMSWGEAKP
jgi:DNA polymerase-1